jgi:hypothetical protein
MTTAPSEAAVQLADALQSGLTGRRLLAELMERFSAISRFDCFLAMAIASALWEADLVIARAELADV